MASFPPAQLEACLMQLMAPDTTSIKQAEDVLKKYLKQMDCIAGFMTQIEQSSQATVRQMAAILLRKKILTYWNKFDTNTKNTIKATLLARSVAETERLVRNSIVQLAASIAKYELAPGLWPELLGFINQCATSPEVIYKTSFILQLSKAMYRKSIEN